MIVPGQMLVISMKRPSKPPTSWTRLYISVVDDSVTYIDFDLDWFGMEILVGSLKMIEAIETSWNETGRMTKVG